jgi:hypothetical protein
MIPYETLLDAARHHFARVAASPNFTREARNAAAALARDTADELDAFNRGRPLRFLEAFDVEPERRRLPYA